MRIARIVVEAAKKKEAKKRNCAQGGPPPRCRVDPPSGYALGVSRVIKYKVNSFVELAIYNMHPCFEEIVPNHDAGNHFVTTVGTEMNRKGMRFLYFDTPFYTLIRSEDKNFAADSRLLKSLKGDPAISGGDPVSVLPPLASLHCNPVIADREEVVITLTRLDPNEISFLTSSQNSECPEKAASCPPRFRKEMQPGIKRSGVGSAHGILSGILAMPFPRAARERRLSNIGGGPEKRKKENKRYLHAFLARRLDRKGRGGELRDRDEGCSRVRIDPIRAIHPSLKRNHVMVDAFSIVTNCLVKEGLCVYKDRPPPSSTFHPRALNCDAQRLESTNGREERGVQEAKKDEEEEEERSESNRECSAASEG
ncbi:hypothetical protein ALC53_09876 [Atta colombica]|uniref:Uncharacterized protein n=1 Tax=Atta colombica TaxID=520822 RepID=A0A151I0V0_9HYME|nr:hypothetical protein ALC53_09876 [Atta colombica]